MAEPEDDFENLSHANFKLGKISYYHLKDYPKARSHLLEFQVHAMMVKKQINNVKNKMQEATAMLTEIEKLNR